MRNMIGIIFGGLLGTFWFICGALCTCILMDGRKESDKAKRKNYANIKNMFPDWDE